MAQCKQSAQEYIQDVFSPMVAVLCSHDAELVCQRNNLTFVELVQPFCRLNSESTIRDSGNMTHTIRNLKITMRDMNQHPPQPTLAKKMMNEAVCNALPANSDSRTNIMTVGDYDLQISGWTAWFEAYRECFNSVAYPSDHEYIRHYLACLFVVSSSHADPMEQLNRLTQQQHQQQHQQPHKPYPKWFCPNVLRYYVLLHDVATEKSIKAEAIYQNMKSHYGVNSCHLLQINSRLQHQGGESGGNKADDPGGTIPDPWSQFLSKRQEYAEGEFDTWSSPGEGDLSFPSQLSEGANSLPSAAAPHNTSGIVDSAVEVTEENSPTSDATEAVIDHPLALDNNSDTSLTQNNLPTPTQPAATTPNSIDKTIINPTHKRSKSGGHGVCLSLSDHDRLRIFVQEFVVRGLIPWAERMLRNLNEQVVTRKGLHRSLFSATKKWFGGGGGGGGSNKSSPSAAATAAADKTNVIYTPEAPEMQQRRLADLAFMFQMYESAYQTYHACKRDFNSDHAWLHFAGSLEMAGLSVYMQGNTSQRQYPHHYMDSAITTYLNSCRNTVFATRATLLSTEALKSKGMYEEAATQFIKMTSEDSDLRSALLLEQASHCFIRMKQPMVRKYAFHMILAGHRFSKAGQRRHALRAYQQALQVYKGKLWSLAEDHINFTIGRQSFNLKQLENAAAAFKHLLTADSKQSPPQQHAFLREYLYVYKQLSSNGTGSELPQLPLPLSDGNAIKVLTAKPQELSQDALAEGREAKMATSVTFESSEMDNATWQKLEELVVVSVEGGSLPNNFKPSIQCSTQRTRNSASPLAMLGEPIMVQVSLSNPLRIPLLLTDVCLLWRFVPLEPDVIPDRPPPVITNEAANESKMADAVSNAVPGAVPDAVSEAVFTESIAQVLLEGSQTQKMQLSVIPHQTGELHITGLAYNLGTNAQSSSSSSPPQLPVATETTDKPTDSTVALTDNNKSSSSPAPICVRGKLNLEVQGPRLNSSKEEKSAKMYGPDRRLDLIVMPAMPLLEVVFYDFPQTLLCGEVRQLSINFTNTGHLPLKNLRISSTHPDFFTFGSYSPSRPAASSLPFSSSSSAYKTLPETDTNNSSAEFTVSESPVKHVTPLGVGEISPGQSVSLPMWVCGPTDTGSHTIRFLFYYESAKPNSKLRHRVLHHEATIDVRPSLLLKASAYRSMACSDRCSPSAPNATSDPAAVTSDPSATSDPKDEDDSKLTVSLQVQNRNTASDTSIKEFQVLQVSCASPEWKLAHLSSNKHSEDVRVCGGESTLMCLRATRCQQQRQLPAADGNRKQQQQQHVFTNVPFTDTEVDSAASPCSDFFVRSRLTGTFEEAEVEAPKPAMVVEEKVDPAEDRLRPLKRALEAKLTLIVLWKAVVTVDSGQEQSVTGQHHVALNKIHEPIVTPDIPKMSMEPKTLQIIPPPREEQGDILTADPAIACQLLQYTLHYPHNVLHDFAKQRLCQTSVSLLLQNCSACPLVVDLKTSQLQSGAASSSSDAPSSDSPSPSASSRGCLWSGQNMTQISLSPTACQAVSLQVCFLKPGVYNLSSSLQVHAAPPNAASVLQKPPAPSLIIISSAQC